MSVDWKLVGGDPAPGEPLAFYSVAKAFSATATNAQQASKDLRAVSSNVDDSIWKGKAAAAFAGKIKELPDQLIKLHDSYAVASQAVQAYGRKLDDLRSRAQRAASQAGTAATETTTQTKAQAQARAIDPLAPTTAQDQAIEAARQRLRGAKTQIEQIRSERKGAEKRLTARLDDAHERGIKNDRWGGLKRFLKTIGDACDKITFVLLIVAVVVIVAVALTNPAGWAALAAGFAAAGPLFTAMGVFGGISFATKAGRKAAGDRSVSTKGLVIEGALTVLPAGAGKLAKGMKGAKGARVVSEAGGASEDLPLSSLRQRLLDRYRRSRFADEVGAIGGRPNGLHDASPGLKKLFADGSVRGRSIIQIRSVLLSDGFKQSLTANKKGYLFTNRLGEQVRIMHRNGGWDVRLRNKFGNYLDEHGQVGIPRDTHDIDVY